MTDPAPEQTAPPFKRPTRHQRQQRNVKRLRAENEELEDLAAGLLVAIDALKPHAPPSLRHLLIGVDEKRRAMGFPTSQGGGAQ